MDGIGGIVGDKVEKILDRKGKRPKAVLSICNWGCIRNKHHLITDDEQKTYFPTVLSRCVTLLRICYTAANTRITTTP